mmetsp:Transcript_42702/g.109305  ORF Transcript_42702/g.109305 Transcript_42702/m.109305 type:complete len:255 (+) Transcript_42702:1878-2642(+)
MHPYLDVVHVKRKRAQVHAVHERALDLLRPQHLAGRRVHEHRLIVRVDGEVAGAVDDVHTVGEPGAIGHRGRAHQAWVVPVEVHKEARPRGLRDRVDLPQRHEADLHLDHQRPAAGRGRRGRHHAVLRRGGQDLRALHQRLDAQLFKALQVQVGDVLQADVLVLYGAQQRLARGSAQRRLHRVERIDRHVHLRRAELAGALLGSHRRPMLAARRADQRTRLLRRLAACPAHRVRESVELLALWPPRLAHCAVNS